MSKYKIEIGTSKLQNAQKQAQKAQKKITEASKNGQGGSANTSQMMRNLTRSIQLLNKSVQDLTKIMSSQHGGAPGRTEGSGSSGGSNGLGKIGAATPLGLGVPIALGSFAISQLVKVGKAHMQKVEEQMSTAGIAGLQRRGAYSYFNAAQMGEYIKSRKMAGGSFDVKDARSGGFHIDYAKRFGITAGEIGQQTGILDRTTKGKGRKTFSNLLGMGHAAGIQTDMPIFIKAITAAMEESIANGISNSNLAKEMGKEIAITSRSAGGNTHFASGIYKTLQGIQKRTSAGQIGDFEGYQMLQAAEQRLNSLIQGKGTQAENDFLNRAIANKDISNKQIVQAKKTGSLSGEARYHMSRLLLYESLPSVQNQYVSNLMNRYGGNGSQTEKKQRVSMLAASLGSQLNIKQLSTLSNKHYDDTVEIDEKSGERKGLYAYKLANRKNAAFSTRELQIKHEELVLGSAAAEAAKSVKKFETTLFDAAKSVEGFVSTVIESMNKAIDYFE